MKSFKGSGLHNVDKGVFKHRNMITEIETDDVTQYSKSNTAEIFPEQAFTLRISSASVISSPYKDLKYAIHKNIPTNSYVGRNKKLSKMLSKAER